MKGALLRGLLAGVAGGVALASALLLLGEPAIGEAIARERAAGGGGGELPRRVQVAGGVAGALLQGAALGVIFAVVFVAARHRLPGGGERLRALSLAGLAFVAVYLVPFLHYPPNPPGVTSADDVGTRTALYLIALAWSLAAVIAAWRIAAAAPARLRAAVGLAAWAVLVGASFAALPAPEPVDAPPHLVREFRIATTVGAAALWIVLGAAFGVAAGRRPRVAPAPRP